jgi:hypothetical protein
MATELLSCPYCNSAVVLSPTEAAKRFIVCPRCQELFPSRAGERTHEVGDQVEAEPAPVWQPNATFPETPPPPRRWSNRSIAAALLATMGTMALIGLIFALSTTASRRQHDHEVKETGPEVTRAIAIAPAKLAALGFVPSDSNIVAGVHVAELLSNPAAHPFLTATPANKSSSMLHSLEEVTGLRLDEVDHAVLGIQVEDRFPPRLILVVQTRQPYDAAKVRSALQAGRSSERKGRTLYAFMLSQSSLEAFVWFAGARIIAFTISKEDFDNVPATPTSDVKRFAPDMRQLLTERLHEGTQAWTVGAATDWSRAFGPAIALPGLDHLALIRLPKVWRTILGGLQSFGLWLQVDSDIAWNLALQGSDPAAAERLSSYLSALALTPGKEFAPLQRRPGGESLAQEWAASLKREQNDNWINLQARSSILALVHALGGQ